MKTWQVLVILLVLALLSTVVVLVLISGAGEVLVSIIALAVLYLAPALIGEEAFDLIDKIIDPKVAPEKKLSSWCHLPLALTAGLSLLGFWVMIAPLLIGVFRVRQWLMYLRPLDETLIWGYSVYSWMFGWWAFVTFILGYFAEKAYQMLRER